MKKILLLILLFILSSVTLLCSEFRSVEKATVIGVISKLLPSDSERELLYKESLSVEINSGKNRGKRDIIINPVYKNSNLNILLKKNDRIIIEEINSDGIYSYKILRVDYGAKLITVAIIFVLTVILIFEMKGLLIQILNCVGAAIMIFAYYPLISRGVNASLLTVLLLFFIVLLYTFVIFKNSFQRKFILTLFIVSQLFSLIIWGIFRWMFRLNGYITTESHYLSSILDKIDIKGFIPAGNLIIAAAAAVMAGSFILHRIKPVMIKNSNEFKKISLLAIKEGSDFYTIFSIVTFLLYAGISYHEITIYYIQNRFNTVPELINGDYVIFIFLRYVTTVFSAAVVIGAAAVFIGYYAKQNSKQNREQ